MVVKWIKQIFVLVVWLNLKIEPGLYMRKKMPESKLNYSDYFQQYIKELRIKSGDKATTSATVEFLYTLMRDYLPVGVIEKIIADQEWNTYDRDSEATAFTNGWLAEYAFNVTERLYLLGEKKRANAKKAKK